MALIDIEIPDFGESVTEATLLKWLKQPGDPVEQDEAVCELETDKANTDVPAPADGVMGEQLAAEGETVKVGAAIGRIDTEATAGAPASKADAAEVEPKDASSPREMADARSDGGAAAASGATAAKQSGNGSEPSRAVLEDLSPAVRRMVAEGNLDPSTIPATGPSGRLTKEDVLNYVDARAEGTATSEKSPPRPAPQEAVSGTHGAPTKSDSLAKPQAAVAAAACDRTRRVPMSKLRKRIAQTLVQAQQTAAILTTFNEIDLTEVMALRKKYKEPFEKKHGVGLGFMSFFATASVLALQQFERVNGSIDGDDMLYHDYVNLGIAVSTERGLTVPVLKDVQAMSFAQIEAEIKRVAGAARDGKLAIAEMSGATFTITNGGVFGSLLSTPILTPPQSGILGMHTIQQRPMAVDGKVEIRPMMYVALSYDHRIVDGKESVSFLVRLKELLEDPARLMLKV